MTELLFKLLDLLLGGLLTRWRERRLLVSEFGALKRSILHVGYVNDLPVELHKLRIFIIERGLVEHPGFREFFSKWLTNPIVISGTAALNVFSSKAVNELQEELNGLQF